MTRAFATIALCLSLVSGAAFAADADIAVTEKLFGCVHTGTKSRNTYFRNADPAKLKEAIRIYQSKTEGAEYPVGTIVQLVPHEAMVKHPKEAFPKSNGWEFLFLDVSADGTKITGRGDTASNRLGTCLSCHQSAAKYDFICAKDQGCGPIPVTDEQLVTIQNGDPRCAKK